MTMNGYILKYKEGMWICATVIDGQPLVVVDRDIRRCVHRMHELLLPAITVIQAGGFVSSVRDLSFDGEA